jgi:cytochrome b561
VHKVAFRAIHLLQYGVLVLLLVSGSAILLGSGLGISPAAVLPDAIVRDLPPVAGHSLLAKIFMALLVMHLIGVFSYQRSSGNVLGRMGVPGASGASA